MTRSIINQANIAEGVTNAIDRHLTREGLDYEDMIEDIVLIQFKDGIIRAYLSYDSNEDQYRIDTEELKNGEEIEQINQRLHFIESDHYIHPTI